MTVMAKGLGIVLLVDKTEKNRLLVKEDGVY